MYKSNLNKYCFSKWKWLKWLDYLHLHWTQKRVTRWHKKTILVYGIFKKCLAFLKQNRKDSHVFVMIWRVSWWLNAKQKLFSESDMKKLICAFRGEAGVKSEGFSTSRDLKEEMVSWKLKKFCSTSSIIYKYRDTSNLDITSFFK